MTACSGRLASGSGHAGSGDGGDGQDASTLDDANESDDSTADSPLPVLPDGPESTDDAPVPIEYDGSTRGCGGVCSASAPVDVISQLAGAWAQCGGQLGLVGPNMGGFPTDTAGMEFDGSGGVYVLVADGAGSLSRGVGPQYDWSVMLVPPPSNSPPNEVGLQFNGGGYLLFYDAMFFPAADGCPAAMHFVNDTSGEPTYASDFVQVGL